MPLFKIAGAPESNIEAGTYEMVLLACAPKDIVVNGEDRAIFEWKFGMVDDDTVEVNGVTSQMTTPRSKLVQWTAALCGPDAIKVGTEFDEKDLIGKRALITIGMGDNGWPKVTDVGPMPTKRTVRARTEESSDELPF
jgi:hypothetical protein